MGMVDIVDITPRHSQLFHVGHVREEALRQRRQNISTQISADSKSQTEHGNEARTGKMNGGGYLWNGQNKYGNEAGTAKNTAGGDIWDAPQRNGR